MCGICGMSAHPNERVNANDVAFAMLLGIESRGQDATGVAWSDGTAISLDKAAVRASQFVTTMTVPDHARTFLGHTRWATQGHPRHNANNHPIDVGGIVGVHNGCLANDDALFNRMGPEHRIAQVDSEAIFAWLLRSGMPVTEALPALRGSAAIAWLDQTDPDTLHLARVSSSPLVIAQTAVGSLLFASTRSCIEDAAALCDLTVEFCTSIDEGTYLTVRHGRVLTCERFTAQTGRALTSVERRALNIA